MATMTTPTGIEFLRTPEDRFAAIDDFPYEPRYVDINGLRMAYLDEGLGDAGVVLLPHGEPTWGYLYRFMIPPLVQAGHRVIVPDLIGFGRSDKPIDRSVYTYDQHVAWMKTFVRSFDDIGPFDVFCQDWGGLISLRCVAEMPDKYNRVVAANTGLPVGESLGAGFDFWLELSQRLDPFECGRLVDNTVNGRTLTDAERAAYDAPFPDESYMACVREFPCLVPITPEHASVAKNMAARKILAQSDHPFLSLWGKGDPVLGHLNKDLISLFPGATGQPHHEFPTGGHFIQDDEGPALAEAMIDWFAATT